MTSIFKFARRMKAHAEKKIEKRPNGKKSTYLYYTDENNSCPVCDKPISMSFEVLSPFSKVKLPWKERRGKRNPDILISGVSREHTVFFFVHKEVSEEGYGSNISTGCFWFEERTAC